MGGPLEGIKIIDWTQWQMGPWATAMLADMGAYVVHIEDKQKGDPGRALNYGTNNYDPLPNGKRAYFEINNRGKKGMAIDLKKPAGKEAIYRMVKNADVFVHNYRQGVPERLGLDYEKLTKINPKLIYCACSGYGPNGTEASEPANDYIGQARSGFMHEVSNPPMMMWGGVADQMGGISAAYGIMLALFAREKTGKGQKVDASLLGGVMTFLGITVNRFCLLGDKAGSVHGTTRLDVRNPLYNHYPCKDNRYLCLSHLQSDRQWPSVCKGIGREDLINDPRFCTSEGRYQHNTELVGILDREFVKKTSKEWMKILKEAGDIICTPVQNISDLLKDPQVLANGYVVEKEHEVFGKVKVLGVPVLLSETPGSVNPNAPEFGQHTEEVLQQLGGYTWEEISKLHDEEVI